VDDLVTVLDADVLVPILTVDDVLNVLVSKWVRLFPRDRLSWGFALVDSVSGR